MKKNEVLSQYFMMFNELPPLIQLLSYENDDYQDLMKNAILNNKKIEEKDLGNFIYDLSHKNKPFDETTEEDFNV